MVPCKFDCQTFMPMDTDLQVQLCCHLHQLWFITLLLLLLQILTFNNSSSHNGDLFKLREMVRIYHHIYCHCLPRCWLRPAAGRLGQKGTCSQFFLIQIQHLYKPCRLLREFRLPQQLQDLQVCLRPSDLILCLRHNHKHNQRSTKATPLCIIINLNNRDNNYILHGPWFPCKYSRQFGADLFIFCFL